MGMFRSIQTELPCEHCQRNRPVDVQFKTGGDGMEVYTAGQLVPPDDDLPIVTTWPAIAGRFCDSCLVIHRHDEILAEHATLAQLVESGRLTLAGKSDAVQLTPEGLGERGRNLADEVLSGRRPARSGEGLWAFTCVWEGVELVPKAYRSWSELADRVRHSTDGRLRDGGWMNGSSTYNGHVRASIDAARRIAVILVAP